MYRNKKIINNKSFSKLFKDIKDTSYENSSYYDCYKTFLSNQKENNKLLLQKINKYEKLSNYNKSNEELNAHKKIWINYLKYSINLKNKIENDILNILTKQILNCTDKGFINAIDSYINDLTINKKEYTKYKNGTIVDIITLYNSINPQVESNEIVKNKNIIKNKISNLNFNLKEEMKNLDHDEKQLSNQILSIYGKYENEINFGNNNPWIIDFETKKPCHFLDCTCLNEEFKNLCYDKYIKFISTNINEISKIKPSKRKFDDFLLIEKLYEEYMKASENRFILLQERISNELNISKIEAKNLVNFYHEYLREKNNYKGSIKSFVSQRNDMINEIIKNITNINKTIKENNISDKDREKQLELIEELHTKIKKWREEKILKLKEEEKVKNLKKLKDLKIKQLENKKKELKKIKNQERLNRYYQIIEEREKMKRIKKEEEKRLEEVRKIKISKYNQERIDYRNRQYQNHLLEKQIKKEKEIELKKLQEQHLEKIRASVGITAEIDPERVKKPTISSMKSKSIYDKDSLFNRIGYSDSQFMKDKRIRVMEELQKEGLLQSNYAKSVISFLTPVSNKYRNKSEISFN